MDIITTMTSVVAVTLFSTFSAAFLIVGVRRQRHRLLIPW
jgi:hypothetical protein